MSIYSVFLFSILALAIGESLAEWHMIWSDEFNGDHLNTNEWQYEVGGNGWGNNELEYYTKDRKENVRVHNGHLVIHVRVENFEGRQFTSARLRTKKGWTYGRFEARARLPKGHQLWPAIWMFPNDQKYGTWAASGEIDIMEYRGDDVHTISGTIHYGGPWPNNTASGSGDKHFKEDFSKDFHVYAIEWDHKQIRWYMDKNHYHTENIDRMMWSHKGHNPYTKNGQPFDQNFFWILNVAVGGNFFGPGPYVTPEQAKHWPKPTMEIDYVRVYHWK